jgi:PhnB protein
MTVKPIPDGYPRLIPYLSVEGAAEAIAFYVSVLGATKRMRMPGPDDKIGHAELEIGGSIVMLADASPQGGRSPREIGGSPVTIMVYVPEVDATYAAAIDAGVESLLTPENQFYGDRAAAFTDPFGHRWHIASHVEEVPAEEMDKRMKEVMGG